MSVHKEKYISLADNNKASVNCGETAIGTGSCVSILIKLSETLYRYIWWHCDSPLQMDEDYNSLAECTTDELVEIFGKGDLISRKELSSDRLLRGVPQYRTKYLKRCCWR